MHTLFISPLPLPPSLTHSLFSPLSDTSPSSLTLHWCTTLTSDQEESYRDDPTPDKRKPPIGPVRGQVGRPQILQVSFLEMKSSNTFFPISSFTTSFLILFFNMNGILFFLFSFFSFLLFFTHPFLNFPYVSFLSFSYLFFVHFFILF